ncbi:DUF4870 domain-containing protein [Pseudarthrobacter sp. J1763]|uniref:DUF4870 domain-containing protein n=1 Tax=Pseudarthrobacter sp. J1763 TaxID=3420445 RepID=UPI003D2A4993
MAQDASTPPPASQNSSPGPHHGEPTEFHGVAANALPLTASEDRQWATLAHFGGILGFVPSLLIYLIFKERGPFTAQESKEALNFTLPPTIAAVLANILVLVPVVGNIFAVIATLIWIALTILSVNAGVHVNRGQPHRYAFNLRLIH